MIHRPSPALSIHLSNLLTYASLLAGAGAFAGALHGNAAACGLLLAAAAILDTFDGRFARRFDRSPFESQMGMHLDSLVDAVTFGLVPVAAASALYVPGAFWWPAAFAYVACAVTRLAFYNVSHGDAPRGVGFIGLPAPVAGLFWATLFLVEPSSGLIVATALVSAVLMVAPLPVPRPSGAGLALFVLWPLTLVVAHSVRLAQ